MSGVRMVTISRENDLLVGYNDVDIVDDGDEMTVGNGDVAADEEAGVVVAAAAAAALPATDPLGAPAPWPPTAGDAAAPMPPGVDL